MPRSAAKGPPGIAGFFERGSGGLVDQQFKIRHLPVGGTPK
jgi:hypothetical protein